MGLWWKRVDTTPPLEGVVAFEGDPKALSKRWPIMWRYHQNWHFVGTRGLRKVVIYFQDHQGNVMRHRKIFECMYLGVRVGKEPIKFWAETPDGEALSLDKIAGFKPSILRRDTESRTVANWVRLTVLCIAYYI